jgi:hypothetical protein
LSEPISLDELHVADPADAWTQAGFAVDDGVCRVGGVRIRLAEGGTGILGWSLRGLATDAKIDGIPTTASHTEPAEPATHPNGVTGIDHVVALSPNLDRTIHSFKAIGVQPRRERDAEMGGRPIRQIFFRFGAVIVEVVSSPQSTSDEAATLWGITYVVADLDATVALLGDRTTPAKAAVQPGRRITTLRHKDFGMSVRTAMISTPILDA